MATSTRYGSLRLSAPKSLPASFLEDRRSVYWDNGLPEKNYSKTTSFALSLRQEQLVYSKRLHPDYQADRSPIWLVSPAARLATPTHRVSELAQPKSLQPNYRPCRQVKTVIPEAALTVRPSKRLTRLSRHKTYPPLLIKNESEWDWGEWTSDISSAAKNATASSRIISLAEPKTTHPLYKKPREIQWEQSKEALSYMATERVGQLAKPKNRYVELEDYDPQAWTVSLAARNAKASPRVDELATPLPRKVRAKK